MRDTNWRCMKCGTAEQSKRDAKGMCRKCYQKQYLSRPSLQERSDGTFAMDDPSYRDKYMTRVSEDDTDPSSDWADADGNEYRFKH